MVQLKDSGTIGRLELPNRVVMPAMGINLATDQGDVSDELISFYEARARGGVGLIITEVTRITNGPGISDPRQLSAYRISDISGIQRLVEVIHQYDTRLFVQLQHPGASASPSVTGGKVVAPSCEFVPNGTIPQVLSIEECADLVKRFVTAAKIVQNSGADGVELHAAHGYLINNFLSPAMNFRKDAYGGSFEKRLRFLLDIVAGIRQSCGDFPLSVRINAFEALPGGMTLSEATAVAQALESAGVDAINVSCYSNGCIEPGTWPEGSKREFSTAVKAAVGIPVIAVNNIKEPRVAEVLLKEGACDFVGIGRGHLADAQWTRKALTGKGDTIRQCIGCLTCFGEIVAVRRIKCAVNPVTGREMDFVHTVKNGEGRRVAIVGGGPAGIEAALVLKERGFDAHLFDEQLQLGGTLNIADKGYKKEKITAYVNSLTAQIVQAGICCHLGEFATPEMLRKLSPCGIFIACGAEPVLPELPGITDNRVVTAERVLCGQVKLKGRVVVVGSGMTGLETAEMLVLSGCRVTLVEMQETVGSGIYPAVIEDILAKLEKYPLMVYLKHQLIAIQPEGLLLSDLDTGDKRMLAADSIVLALGVHPRQSVVDTIVRSFPQLPVVVIGDARKSGRILEATQDAHRRSFVFKEDI